MIQGGGFDETLNRRSATYPPIELEIISWLSHQPGVISMARTSDPHSATSQFFVCVSDDSFLDGDYAAFGEVESGYDVVESISAVATHSTGGMDDVPVTNVVMTSVTRL
jgi:cyclophilin family peptidyl-prolyl cis-trans isomerase